MKELPKAYEPQKYEDGIYKKWEESGYFNPDVCIEKGVTDKDAEPFSIVLPPPNVTGTLHIGHAVMLAIEDVMVRYHRMKGDKTLWVPGTDHAAIATQEKVERLLWDTEKKTRHDLGREEFLKRVDQFAKDSHDTIVNQAKKMGTSLDWSREYYSLDENLNIAVRTAFTTMYEEGLIYRGDRIVNWDPKMQSNVSDIEVDRKEQKTRFYYFKYGPFEIGTARPETKFGDKYVVMHPDDKRYKDYKHGDTFECEWINGKITATIIKDEAVDPEFGTGVMTITPWHDATDFAIAERHNLDKEQIIDKDGKLMPVAGEFAGMDIFEARPKIVEKLKEKGLLTKVDEDYVHQIATNSRGGGVIEPQIMKQWWMDVNKKFKAKSGKLTGIKEGQEITLQEVMQQVVKSGQIEILPENFKKIYFHWIDNLQDWCLSRQLWFGHRVPAWYRDDEVYVGVDAPEGEGWEQDPDTLDTWFSAGLFTFSPLGWPNETDDSKIYHPTSVLETGYDTLFFWVARMILMSTYHLGDIPFKTVYLHGLVRDEKGRKMSKSLDNIINPLDVCEKYGTDAVRLSLMIGSTPGNDTKLSEEKIASFRNFANKLWNISRFMLMQIDNEQITMNNEQTLEARTLSDLWILKKMESVVAIISGDLENYQFSQAGETLRDFTWNELADWYLEIVKIEGGKSEILNYVLNTILKLWHPYMPFVTEAIWKEVYGEDQMLMVESWPKNTDGVEQGYKKGVSTFVEFGIIQEIIVGIRSLRADLNIEPGKKINIRVSAGDKVDLLNENVEVIKGLARLEKIEIETKIEKKDGEVGFVSGGIEVFVNLSGAVDIEKEKSRIEKEIAKVEPYVSSLEKKLSNKGFTDNAPEEILAGEKKKLEEAKEKLEKLQEQLTNLN